MFEKIMVGVAVASAVLNAAAAFISPYGRVESGIFSAISVVAAVMLYRTLARGNKDDE